MRGSGEVRAVILALFSVLVQHTEAAKMDWSAGSQALAGKVCLVTGASRGVGKGIALGLGEQGATVYLTGRSQVRVGSPFSGGTISGTKKTDDPRMRCKRQQRR